MPTHYPGRGPRRTAGRQPLPPIRGIELATGPVDRETDDLCQRNLAAQRKFNGGEGRSRTAGEGRGRR